MEIQKVTVLACNQLRARDAAKFLGVSERTLANWRVLGYGPQWIKRGGRGRVFYALDAVSDYAANSKKN